MRYCIVLGLTLVIGVLDQICKWAVTASLALHEGVPITSFFNLVHVRNYGAAFGFLNDPSLSWQTWLFAGAAVLAAVLILWLTHKAAAHEWLLFTALGCILGGAVGNLVDRLRLGAVVDFLDFHYAGMHWPAFNVADMAICLGAGLTILVLLRPVGGQKAPEIQ
ncbi:signal peptidase II [Desulfovibrio sp. OttesenSCG-928-M16]|nr:signal peptidase II [Desulfovibrio sp. OttesenSCG-928-M16]